MNGAKANEIQNLALIDEIREVKNSREYDHLITVSQYPFQQDHENGFWLEGYPLGSTPINSEEGFNLIEFSLENGDFVTHPFALEEGWDANYQKFMSVIGVDPLSNKTVPYAIFVKPCGLFVSTKFEEGKLSYFLHDIAHVSELSMLKVSNTNS